MDRNSDFEQQSRPDKPAEHKKVVPVVEEQLQVGKQIVESGSLRISKKVREEDVTVDVPITYSEHEVERVAVNQFVDSPPPIRYEGNTMIIPILEEVVVLEKRLKVVEELRVTARQVQSQSTQQVTLRKEEVSIERNNDSAERSNRDQAEIKIVPKDTDA